jgi:hypothetical protein
MIGGGGGGAGDIKTLLGDDIIKLPNTNANTSVKVRVDILVTETLEFGVYV